MGAPGAAGFGALYGLAANLADHGVGVQMGFRVGFAAPGSTTCNMKDVILWRHKSRNVIDCTPGCNFDMANPALSWNRPIKEIWEELAETANDPDAPYCRKLVLLAQLKTAEAAKSYTKWLMFLTVVIVLCTVVQTFVAALNYQHSPIR